jgi:hypothetical protein
LSLSPAQRGHETYIASIIKVQVLPGSKQSWRRSRGLGRHTPHCRSRPSHARRSTGTITDTVPDRLLVSHTGQCDAPLPVADPGRVLECLPRPLQDCGGLGLTAEQLDRRKDLSALNPEVWGGSLQVLYCGEAGQWSITPLRSNSSLLAPAFVSILGQGSHRSRPPGPGSRSLWVPLG